MRKRCLITRVLRGELFNQSVNACSRRLTRPPAMRVWFGLLPTDDRISHHCLCERPGFQTTLLGTKLTPGPFRLPRGGAVGSLRQMKLQPDFKTGIADGCEEAFPPHLSKQPIQPFPTVHVHNNPALIDGFQFVLRHPVLESRHHCFGIRAPPN